MPTADIFQFESPDLVNLQKWFKKLPREFTRAATNVTNTMAFQARTQAIKNIEKATHTRNKSFVKRSMRVDKARHGQSLSNIVASMGSIDISRQGRSTGFEELETGSRTKKDRVPTLAARGGSESKQVSRPVRMNQVGKMLNRRKFRGKHLRNPTARTLAMLRHVRAGKVGRRPFVIESGLTGPLAGMVPGVYKLGNKKTINLMNPFGGSKPKSTKKIKWMDNAIKEVTKDSNLKAIWSKEVDFVLKKRK